MKVMKRYKVKPTKVKSTIDSIKYTDTKPYISSLPEKKQIKTLDKERNRIFELAKDVWQSIYPNVEMSESVEVHDLDFFTNS